MTATAHTTPETDVFSAFEAKAQAATMENYTALLEELAAYTVKDVFDPVQRTMLINALGDNKTLGIGRRAAQKALEAVEKAIKRAMAAPPQDTVQGGQGAYAIRDGWLCRLTKDGDYIRVSTAIEVLGRTRNTDQTGWGKLLRWRDGDDVTHTWAMPMRLMSGEGGEVIGVLLERGVSVAGGASKYVADYLQMCDSERRLTCVDKTGWYDGRVFVTPAGNIGDYDESLIYQGTIKKAHHAVKGTLEGWRNEVASLAKGNSRLTFVISSAFAPALLDLAPNVGTGGFQFTGDSKDGKTLVCGAASSTFGYWKSVKRSWHGTANGIETIAAQHNDGWLFLDEQKRATGKDVDRIIYMLSDGEGKARQEKHGGDLRAMLMWKLLWFSTGELSAADYIQQSGGTPPAGIEIRQADIPADAGKGFHIHDTIHDYPDVNAFNAAIGAGIENHYGIVGQEWLAKLVVEREELNTRVPVMLETIASEIVGGKFSPQTRDALYRFALVAVAGELATEYGLTGWEQGESTAAAKRVFSDWLTAFGGDDSSREQRQIVHAVRAFLNSNMSRFQNMAFETPKEELQRVHNCVGGVIPAYDDHSQAVFLVFNSQLKELAKGYSKKQIAGALEQAGMIQPPIKDGREYIPAHGQQRVTRIIATDETED